MSIDAEALARLRSLLAKARATHSAEGAASVEKSHADDDAALLLLDGDIPVGRFDCIHDAEAFATAFNVLREHGDELLDTIEAVARDGWALVPVESTREMRIKGAAAAEFWIGGDRWHLQVDGDPDEWPDTEPALQLAWAAMIDAARPTPEGAE